MLLLQQGVCNHQRSCCVPICRTSLGDHHRYTSSIHTYAHKLMMPVVTNTRTWRTCLTTPEQEQRAAEQHAHVGVANCCRLKQQQSALATNCCCTCGVPGADTRKDNSKQLL
jgi:hypothetical protein